MPNFTAGLVLFRVFPHQKTVLPRF
ncbi:MAG: hypothetical protein UW52_C0023G0001, partial [Candidatus Gottesmanbacteria bacterium GW2011_GWA1_44_24b]